MQIHCVHTWDTAEHVCVGHSAGRKGASVIHGGWSQKPDRVITVRRAPGGPRGSEKPTGRFCRDVDWYVVSAELIVATDRARGGCREHSFGPEACGIEPAGLDGRSRQHVRSDRGLQAARETRRAGAS